MNQPATIGLVDDDPAMLRALSRLLRARGFVVRTFDSPAGFLAQREGARLDCAVLDVSMPGLTGLEVQQALRQIGARLPIVFLTGRGDIPTSVRAIKAGAVNFLTKPVDEGELLAAVAAALEQAGRERASDDALAGLRSRAGRLTPREFEVWRHVVAGRLNKQIAANLGISEQTVKVHRMRLTAKLGIASVADLVRAAERLGIPPIG
jgi:FixJ family two-component response regulator